MKIARIVDHLSKSVLSVGRLGNTSIDVDKDSERRYNHWGTEQMCNNCVSMRAISENDTCIKFEMTKEKIYMITALPVRLDERVVAD